MLFTAVLLLSINHLCHGKPQPELVQTGRNSTTDSSTQPAVTPGWVYSIPNYGEKPYIRGSPRLKRNHTRVTLTGNYHSYSQRTYPSREHRIQIRSVPDVDREHDRLAINGLDCRNPIKVRNGLVRNICQKKEAALPALEPIEAVTILQRSTSRTTKAYRCTKFISKVITSCGSFIPTKIYGPPDILQAVPLPAMECQRSIKRRAFQTETGRIIKINLNMTYTYKYMLWGSLAVSPDHVSCRGPAILINGQEHKSTIAMVTARIGFTEVTVGIDEDSMVDLESNSKLPEGCRLKGACDSGHTGYVFLQPDKVCPLYIIKSIPMQKIRLTTDHGEQEAYINKEHKLLLISKQDEATEDSCGTITKVGATQYPNIKILHDDNTPMGSIQKVIMELKPSQIDLETGLKASIEYEAYALEQQLNQQLYIMGSNLCMMNRQGLHQTEISPFHNDSLIRISGDIVREIQCQPIVAEAELGEDRNHKCYSDAIPVWYNSEPLFMTIRNKLIVEEDLLSVIPCESQSAGILKTNNGNFIQATPIVKIIEVKQLQRIEAGYLHHLNDSIPHHQEFSRELLYQGDQLETIEQTIHFGRTREHVLDSLVKQYCHNGDRKSTICGEYRPPHPGEFEFEISHLKGKISDNASWGEYLHGKAKEQSNGCNIVVLLYLGISLLIKIAKTIICVHWHGEDIFSATKQNFFACTQVHRRANKRRSKERGSNSNTYISATFLNDTGSIFLDSRIREFYEPEQP